MATRQTRIAEPEVWGGLECTINRKQGQYRDQLELSGHYERKNDLEAFAKLGIKAIRYPVLWEKHVTKEGDAIDWTWASEQLGTLRKLGVEPIVGLVHHGSGPAFTSLADPAFPKLLAAYAKKVALQFPWVQYFTPVNEPLTTARFSGLYGLWHPHGRTANEFLTMLLNQVEAVVRSMKAIREVNPAAKLVQTEDIGKTHSTPNLRYQATFENHRRWLTYDLLCGRLDKTHPLWQYFMESGISPDRLRFFVDNPCVPDIAGFNYYVTSERYLDENIEKFPACEHGTNGRQAYADTVAARVVKTAGIGQLLREAWKRYRLPMAITEAHLDCSREEQLRWLKEIWDNCCKLAKDGIPVKAVTAWSLLGAYDWDSLLVKDAGRYESGVFDVSNIERRPTAMVKLIRSLSETGGYDHPVLENEGWWRRHNPVLQRLTPAHPIKQPTPLLIIGKSGTLANAFSRICEHRGIHFRMLSRQDIDITDTASIDAILDGCRPWAVINTAGYVNLDDAETEVSECYKINAQAPALLAGACARHGIPFMTFSTDMVFSGDKRSPYKETDRVFPINTYGRSKADGEAAVMDAYKQSLIIRTSAFFGPWDQYNFVYRVIDSLSREQHYSVVKDVIISPTYVPDLVNVSLNLLMDEATGILHISNNGSVTWADFASEVAQRSGYPKSKILVKTVEEMDWKASRPIYSALESEKGIMLPFLGNAIDRYFTDKAV